MNNDGFVYQQQQGTFFSPLQRWVKHPSFLLWVALFGIFLCIPAILVGWQSDDFYHRGIFLQQSIIPPITDDASLWGLFSFLDGNPERAKAAIDAGTLPWWILDTVRINFWRPFAELTHFIDYRLWPNTSELMHLQTFFWLGLLLFTLGKLYQQIHQGHWLAGLAVILYAIDSEHGVVVGWIANRNSLLATFFGVLTLLLHHQWRNQQRQHAAPLALLTYTLSLLSAEFGIATCAYLFSYSLFLDKGPLWRRALNILPYAVITIAWRLFYNTQGFGAFGSNTYIDPVGTPGLFLETLTVRLPVLLLGQWALPPPEFHTALLPAYATSMWCFAVAFLCILAGLLMPLLRHSAATRFWALGMLLAAIPICAASLHGRLLLFVGIGAMGLAAQLLACWAQPPAWFRLSRIQRIAGNALAIIFIAIHMVLSPLLLPLTSWSPKLLGAETKIAYDLPISDTAGQPQNVVMLNLPVATNMGVVMQMRKLAGQPIGDNNWLLNSNTGSLEVSRIDPYTLRLHAPNGLIRKNYDQLFRGKRWPIHSGERIELNGLTVVVTETTLDHRPMTANFEFTVPLDDPSLVFLAWQGKNNVAPFSPPSAHQPVVLNQTRSAGNQDDHPPTEQPTPAPQSQ